MFLASDEASFITGAAIPVDSGVGAMSPSGQDSMYNGNKLRLGLFGINVEGECRSRPRRRGGTRPGTTASRSRGWRTRPASEFLLPIGRWRGYGGASDFHGTSLETITWATGILANTSSCTVFGTIHARFPPDHRCEADGHRRYVLQGQVRAQPRLRLEPGRVRHVRPGAARARRPLRLRGGVAGRRANGLARATGSTTAGTSSTSTASSGGRSRTAATSTC